MSFAINAQREVLDPDAMTFLSPHIQGDIIRTLDQITPIEAGVGASTGPAGKTLRDWHVVAAFCVSRGSNCIEIAYSVPPEAQEHAGNDG